MTHELQVHRIELETQNEQLRRTQAELESARDRYADLYDFAPVGYLTLDDGGLIIEANLTSVKLLGMPRAKLIGRQFLSRVMPADRKRWKEHLQRLLEHRGQARAELALLRDDGQPFDAQLDCLLTATPGAASQIRLTLFDISERRRVEAELQLAATAFETQEGIMITDANGVIVRVNKTFTQITGYSREEAVGRHASLMSSGRHDAAFFAAMWERLRHDGSWLGEIWNRRKSGEVYPQSLAITAVPDRRSHVLRYVGTMRDIADRKAREAEIELLAFYDALTELPNRRLMEDRLRQAMAISTRTGHSGALMFIDLDRFKAINDRLGHDAGDRLLQQVAERLSNCLREGDTVARIGGDEFVVILAADLSESAEAATAQARAVAEKMLVNLRRPFEIGGHAQACSASIGMTLFKDHACTAAELLERSDQAMYQGKTAGRNQLVVFDAGLLAHARARSTHMNELRAAVAERRFILLYQPVVDGHSKLLGAEALVRWRHPTRGLVVPETFIPLAEDSGLIHALGYQVLEAACKQLAAWAGDTDTAALTLSVNVSARQLHAAGFVQQVLEVLARSGAPAARLRLELTETAMVENLEECATKLRQLKAHGVGFSLDDFGTRYASLTYLKRLPLDQLKIDRSFVRDILTDPQDAAIVRTVVGLGHSLDLMVIAEGVETVAQLDCLAGYGCQAFQGHLFGLPQSAQSLRQRVKPPEATATIHPGAAARDTADGR